MQALILIPYGQSPEPEPVEVGDILNEFVPEQDAFTNFDDDKPWQIVLCRATFEPSSDHSSGKLSFQMVMQWPSIKAALSISTQIKKKRVDWLIS